MQYLVNETARYSNGAHIENVAGCPEWQRLLCPCQPHNPYKFKLSETQRLRVFSSDENEHTHLLSTRKKPSTEGGTVTNPEPLTLPICPICHKPCPLEVRVTDPQGRDVHKECHRTALIEGRESL
jgi:hypothetical protein